MECDSPLATRPIFYTDTIGDKQVLRDDLWAVTTEELNKIEIELSELRSRVRDYESPMRDRRTTEQRMIASECLRMEDAISAHPE